MPRLVASRENRLRTWALAASIALGSAACSGSSSDEYEGSEPDGGHMHGDSSVEQPGDGDEGDGDGQSFDAGEEPTDAGLDASEEPFDAGIDASGGEDSGDAPPDAGDDEDASRPTLASCEGEVLLPDANFEALIRSALSIPTGPISETAALTLTELTGGDAVLANLDGIQCFPNLTSVWLASSSITDIAPIAQLPALTTLNLTNNPITDFEPLSALSQLTRLIVSETVDDAALEVIGGLTNLSALNIRGPFTDISPLAALSQLDDLAMSKSTDDVVDLSPLSGLANLRAISFVLPGVSDISPLASIASLRQVSLYLASIDLTDLPAFAAYTDISLLQLQETGTPIIDDLSPLAGMSGLRNLQLYQVDADPSELAPLTELTALALTGVPVGSDLGALPAFPDLFALTLTNCGIEDISDLAAMTMLQGLDLSDNSIVDLGPLSGLDSLFSLRLTSNAITDLSPLVANTGIGSGDNVSVDGNPFDCTTQANNITTLTSRGVNLTSGCP
jgi:Leucine-rich repeat (LRR) protein